ncbi:PD-(D/E)XK nuclease family protein [Sphingobacterium siyangense]|uniref:RecB family exonuclease n=1 Tax=Sphingobacterium siyangense TaxID=459529 RepID=A0A562MB78_9SPHI|nr:PD-(D/E)XK nuclease family protein [Sphingobacterium siyangense]TWI17207.1 RecB family exonuclease [Sphingobacterium siyangense]
MINKIEEINFKEIKRISPSQFYSMKNCAYKSLLTEAFDNKPLLPISVNAHFGIVFHKVLELILKGVIKNEDDFNEEFEKKIKELEDDLMKNGFSFLVPVKIKVKNIGLKKAQLKKHLRSKTEQSTSWKSTKFYSEKWLESNDKLIGGKVDLIIKKSNSIEIVDFKTGAIIEDYLDGKGGVFADIKSGYKEQLKLYAYLYFENTSKFPTSLSLVNLTKQKFSVEFTEEECKSVFEEAKRLLITTNDSVRTGAFSATPKEENCKYCLFRPACSFFLRKLEKDFSLNDVMGEIKDVKKFKNGKMSVFLHTGKRLVTIKNFNADGFDYFMGSNKKISIYNLRKEVAEFIYSATDTTMIYE